VPLINRGDATKSHPAGQPTAGEILVNDDRESSDRPASRGPDQRGRMVRVGRIALGAVLLPVSRIGSINVLAPVPDVLFLLGLAPLGWSLVQGRVSLAERFPSLVTRWVC